MKKEIEKKEEEFEDKYIQFNFKSIIKEFCIDCLKEFKIIPDFLFVEDILEKIKEDCKLYSVLIIYEDCELDLLCYKKEHIKEIIKEIIIKENKMERIKKNEIDILLDCIIDSKREVCKNKQYFKEMLDKIINRKCKRKEKLYLISGKELEVFYEEEKEVLFLNGKSDTIKIIENYLIEDILNDSIKIKRISEDYIDEYKYEGEDILFIKEVKSINKIKEKIEEIRKKTNIIIISDKVILKKEERDIIKELDIKKFLISSIKEEINTDINDFITKIINNRDLFLKEIKNI